MTKINSLLIDLDGTMIDSISDISDAINIMLKETSSDCVSEDTVKTFIGSGIDNLISNSLLYCSNNKSVSKNDFIKAKSLFFKNYKKINGNKTVVYKGVFDGLIMLKKDGIRASVVTNKPTKLAMQVLQNTKLLPFFKYVICGDTCNRCKPFPDQILLACTKMNIKPQQSLFIGDSINDVLSANAANTAATLLVRYGYNNSPDIYTMGADDVIDDLTKVSQWVHHYNEYAL